jgi:multidrug efflux pump subunit AcrA (membrane-fusion protein)
MIQRKTLSARFPLMIGFAAAATMLAGFGTWSVATEISGAVIASGTVVVENDRQVVQHADGGVVGEILARDGDVVAAGDVLLRLDGTFLRSELAVVERQIAEFYARRARLIAERDGAEALVPFDPPQFDLVTEQEVAAQLDGQTTLFEARRRTLAQEQDQLREQQAQIERQIEGFEAQLNGLRRPARADHRGNGQCGVSC